MTEKEFRAEIKRGLSGGYLIFGEEEYLKNHVVDLAVKSVVGDDDFSSVNLMETDEDSYSDDFLFDAVSSVPMMAEKCCAVCRVRFSKLEAESKEIVFAALDSLKNNPSLVLLVVIPSGYFDPGQPGKGKPSAEYSELEKYLIPVCVPYQPQGVLKKWAERHFAKDGLAVPDEALSLIVDLCGPDMYALAGEIEKLSCYTLSKGQRAVSKEDALLVCTGNGDLDAFALSNAVVSGDRERAIAAVRECRDKRQKPVSVIARMTSEFMNMMSVSILMRNGMLKNDISKKLGIHEYRVGKYMESLRDVDTSTVRAVIERCTEVDEALKTTGGGFELIERFVCTIPAKRKYGGRFGT